MHSLGHSGRVQASLEGRPSCGVPLPPLPRREAPGPHPKRGGLSPPLGPQPRPRRVWGYSSRTPGCPPGWSGLVLWLGARLPEAHWAHTYLRAPGPRACQDRGQW